MDITTATPVQIDTDLAELRAQLDKAVSVFDGALNSIHTKVGDRKGRHGYRLSHDEARAQAREALDNRTLRRFDHDVVTRAFDILDEQDEIITALTARIAPLDAEYARRPWSRFILVLASGGHIHSSNYCAGGSIRVTTQLAWNPQLSGKTEAEAVAELGPLLCTHCFPTAPVEYTIGKPKPQHCAGSGEAPVSGTVTRLRRNTSGRCTGCQVSRPLTQYGVVRAHPPVK